MASAPRRRPGRLASVPLAVAACAALLASPPVDAEQPAAKGEGAPSARAADDAAGNTSIKTYYAELERLGLVDVDTGSKTHLVRELSAAEKLLRQGANVDAAVSLYAIVESPRFSAFDDFVAYQNAEYYLGVALSRAGAYQAALDYLVRVMNRGPSTMYFAPAHRKAVDIAIETRDYTGVLGRFTGLKLNEPIPPGAAGERSYLRARAHYVAREFDKAEGQLVRISRKSRLYSSALYLRGVIRARQGQFVKAAEALCEIVDTPDDDKFTFVVDNRYFTIKDLARLGLGRIAHEKGDFNDAYYHYFQIPDDSDRLPEALFEASWSMYQKRELATARDLVDEFLKNFPTAPQMPEARLLAGYIELADCKFDKAQKYYDQLIAELQPVADSIAAIRKDPARRKALFARALARWRAERADPGKRLAPRKTNMQDKVIGLLRLEPKFVRLHDSVTGLRAAAGDAPHVIRAWRTLARRVAKTKVKSISTEKSVDEEDAADANGLLEDVRRLGLDITAAQARLKRGVADKTIAPDAAAQETKRLAALGTKVAALQDKAKQAAASADDALTKRAAPAIAPMIKTDIQRARDLRRAATRLQQKLGGAADRMAKRSLDKLYLSIRRVLDKAKLGKIDAVIGQKRKLDIQVQDLAAGRYPVELHGRLWEQGLIGDDEEYWPFQGEYWADEYEGWR